MSEVSHLPCPNGPSEVIARTASGDVVGRRLAGGEYQFLGVPYAASPNTSDTRFRAPVDHESWRGLRDATTDGPSCPQPVVDYWGRPGDQPTAAWGNGGNWYDLFAPTYRPGDDYLTVNITTPGEGADPLPVLVYLHGGAFSLGNNSMPVYNGVRMAALDVVYVAVNYRLGAEGFWHVKGGDSNVGLRDQIQALGWIQRNIANFGGDGSNVTIMGQSAGAGSAGLLSVSPATHGLFHRSIALSSGVPGAIGSEDSAEDAQRLATAINVPAEREALVRIGPEDLVRRIHEAQLDPVRPCPHGRMDYSTIFVPKVDGEIVLESFREDFANAADSRPMITGITADESAWRVYQTGAHDVYGEQELLDYLGQICAEPSGALERFRAVYPKASYADLRARVMFYDMYLKNILPPLAARASSRPGQTYCYLFDEKSQAAGGRYGAFHLSDLPYTFDVLDHPAAISMAGRRGPQQTADEIRASWKSFIHSGECPWPPYVPGEMTIRRFGQGGPRHVDAYGDGDLLEYWKGVRK